MLNWLKNLVFGSCLHSWSSWKRCSIRVIDEWDVEGSSSTVVSGQSKECYKCGKIKTRKI